MTAALYHLTFLLDFIHSTLQDCPSEISSGDAYVMWHQTPTAENITSSPQCYNNETLITRNCSGSTWIPSLDKLPPCTKVMKHINFTSCLPGYKTITDSNTDYCYHIGESMPWDFPCFTSGGSSVITDLSSTEIVHLLNYLKKTNTSRYFWLPAQKENLVNPVVWKIPGPNWGKVVTSNGILRLREHFFKRCLLLDVYESVLVTDCCLKSYPTFCVYINNLHYPAECPSGYHPFRSTSESGSCYGIVEADTSQGLSFYDFLQNKCSRPMSDDKNLNRFIFQKLAGINKLSKSQWCWFKKSQNKVVDPSGRNTFEGILNNDGGLGIMNANFSLSCMACQTEVIYKETELMFEYNSDENVIYLTIYNPAGLWKNNGNDKGIQCFSDAKGYVRSIHVNDDPFMNIQVLHKDSALGTFEKIVYVVDLVTDTSAQYWCEGHTVNFSLIATDKMIVNPKGNQIHVFSLVIKCPILSDNPENITDIYSIVLGTNFSEIFGAKKVLLMDILSYTLDYMLILLHLHVIIHNVYDDLALNIQETYINLTEISETKLVDYNYTFVNLSSSMVCLPAFSIDVVMLEWEMTPIGHIAAPKQFCLQSNGLPVKRICEGSYKLGGTWGEVEGHCDTAYEATKTTTFLYNFIKLPTYRPISQFLTEDLNHVLGHPETIIPADIYYLSMSLQQISDITQDNVTSLNTTDIEHLAWIMDRVMILDCEYLRLAQTLNSTNVIVDSISEIIETIAKKNMNETSELSDIAHQLVVQPQFTVQISYPDWNNITGIAIVNKTTSESFADTFIYPLYKNTTLADVFSIKYLEIATWIPTEMLDSLHAHNNTNYTSDSDNNLNIIITVYQNDAVFQELENHEHVINSRIIGVSIPGYISNLEYPIPVVFKQINNTMKSICGFWDFQPQNGNHVPGSWKSQGCYLVQSFNDITLCECYHLTHFGQLFFNNIVDDKLALNEGHTLALNIITLIGCFLSLFGIVGIWITALIFSKWRKKPGTKVLLQLATAIAMPLIFIVTFNLNYSMFNRDNGNYYIAPNKKVSCIILGALLHYSILASFMWMLITAVLQFIRYVRVLGVQRPSRYLFKFALIGWGLPLLPVIITLSLDSDNYVPIPAAVRNICYPSGNYLIVATLVPLCVILFVNIGLFILVLHAISIRSNVDMKNTDMDLVGAQLRVSIFLFFLLGLTWIFGIFSFSNSLIWSYLFCLTSTLQGFVLFIYFIICDPNTRGLWVTLMTPQLSSHSSRSSVTSISVG